MCLRYLNDVIVYSHDIAEHCARLRIPSYPDFDNTCSLRDVHVAFLGHLISASGVQANPDKVKAVMSISEPQTVKERRSFLCLVGYYRRFISGFATITAPLTELTIKNRKDI